MWIAKTKHFEDDELFVPSKVLIFSGKPNLDPNGHWYYTDDKGVDEYGIEIPAHLFPDADMLKERECMEVIILPAITRPEILHKNPVYKAILDYGCEIRDNSIGDAVIGEHGKRFEYCKNCGHPWCKTGAHCMDCALWHFDINLLITKMKGQI